jgi:hypothetical protein
MHLIKFRMFYLNNNEVYNIGKFIDIILHNKLFF